MMQCASVLINSQQYTTMYLTHPHIRLYLRKVTFGPFLQSMLHELIEARVIGSLKLKNSLRFIVQDDSAIDVPLKTQYARILVELPLVDNEQSCLLQVVDDHLFELMTDLECDHKFGITWQTIITF